MQQPLDGMPESSPAAGRRNRTALLVLGTGAAAGLHMGLLHLLIWRQRGEPALLVIGIFVLGSLIFSGAAYALWRWVFPRLQGRRLPEQLVTQGAVALGAMSLLSFAMTEIVRRLLEAPPLVGVAVGPEFTVILTPETRQIAVRFYALMPIVPMVLVALIGYHQYWRPVLVLRVRERRLTELAATAQLVALRARINPHFLFNSLNSIAQLVRSDPGRAEESIERLAELFRYILRHAEKELVPLADELRLADVYLELESIRFGDRLRVERSIDPASLSCTVPNLVLQPLVENAVRHGLARKVGPGTIRIEARVDAGRLAITIADDGLGMTRGALADLFERGVGLSNLRARLARLYGDDCVPRVSSTAGAGTTVRLTLPARAVEAAA